MKTIADIQRNIVAQVEIIEGRVPSDEEIAMHVAREIHPGRVCVYFWKGVRILELHVKDYCNIDVLSFAS